jgi:L-tyrosine isonitrile synthase
MSSVVALSASSLATLSFTREHETHAVVASYGRASPCNDKPGSGPGDQFKERNPLEANIRAGAEKILRSFNTWAFKREQPSDPQLMARVIADAVARQAPVPFVLYWGKGPRHEASAPEAQCLDFLAALASRVKAAYAPGAALKLILTDTHAELNGHCRQDIERYFDEIRFAAEQRGFDTCWLGQLVKAAGNVGIAAPLEEAVPAETLLSLTASAEKWYHGSGTPQDGALTYLRMNLIEQRVVERAFPGSIFITFNGSDLRSLFPTQLPIFYMYSLRRGMSVKPWFVPAEPAKCGANADQKSQVQPN